MIRRLILSAAIATLVAACASSPTNAPGAPASDPREKDPKFRYGNNRPGPSPVGVIPDVTLSDAQRNRDIRITIEYPIRSGSFPLIVVSHASGLSNRSYPGLTAHWASYEYVVIRVSHADNDTNIDAMTTALWRDRVRDITFTLDSLTSLAERYPELQGKIDATKIGVAGHGRGAVTALMLGGLRTFPGAVTFADPRVKAVVAMSPAGPQQAWGLTNESFAEVRVPALFMTGSRDTGATETETVEWRQQAFQLAPAGDKWLVTIEGAGGSTFTGTAAPLPRDSSGNVVQPRTQIGGITPQQVEQERMNRARNTGYSQRVLFAQARALVLAFFDNYLKGNAAGREFLQEADGRDNVEVATK
jgi:predicted dienelactone hydrolase